MWVTADTHFSHPFMVRNRGFASVEEHDELLIERWNETIPPGGLVYVLGDIFWYHRTIPELLPRLHGDIHVVLGNHDRRRQLSKHSRLHLHDPLTLKWRGQRIWLSHYAHRTWPNQSHGAWHLHGHSHGNLPDWWWLPMLDVGVDTHSELRPYALEDIADDLEERANSVCEPVDALKHMLWLIEHDDALSSRIPADVLRKAQTIPHLMGGDHHINKKQRGSGTSTDESGS